MIIALIIALVCVPLIFGMGLDAVMKKKSPHKPTVLWEVYIYGILCCVGVFEMGHLAGVFTGKTVTFCGRLILAMLAVLLGAAVVRLLTGKRTLRRSGTDTQRRLFFKKETGKRPDERRFMHASLVLKAGVLLFVMVFAGQLVYILTNPPLWTTGDILPETVQSFLATDGIYTVSPLTGKAYSGAPLRYEILCLPTLYTLLSKWFDAAPEILMEKIIPVLVLCMSYGAYYLLGGTLFRGGEQESRGREKQGREKQVWFLVFLGILIWFSEGAVYLEGYGLLHGGYLGTTLRNSVLVPFVIYELLNRKWFGVVLCILAEACIVWTFWGLGICGAAAGIFLLADLAGRIAGRKAGKKAGKSPVKEESGHV